MKKYYMSETPATPLDPPWDGAADSTRCIGLCAHCTRLSTTSPGKLSANAWKGTMAT